VTKDAQQLVRDLIRATLTAPPVRVAFETRILSPSEEELWKARYEALRRCREEVIPMAKKGKKGKC